MWVDAVSIEQIADTPVNWPPGARSRKKAQQAAQTLLNEYAALNAEYAGKAKSASFFSLA